MKAKQISEVLSNMSDKYVEEAAKYKNPVTKSMRVWRAIAIAACCLLAVPITIAAVAAVSRAAGGRMKVAVTDALHSDYYEKNRQDIAFEEGDLYDLAFIGNDGMKNEKAGEAGEAELSPSVQTNPQDGESPLITPATKIIYTAYIRMQSTEFDKAVSGIEALVNASGGYFQDKQLSGLAGDYRSADFIIRVPVNNYEGIVAGLEDVAAIISKNQSAEDVSEYYYDVESRLASARIKLTRLQELLSKAENMEDIISLENAISEAEWEVENLQGTLKHYDSLINFSTITINLAEVYKVDHVTAPMTFGERINASFKEGLENFADSMGELAIWFAGSWLWLVLIFGIQVVVIIIIVVSVKKAARRRRKKEAE
ncbi:MAG: DUF4349 domain-containing protein [Lachnospiraceae bacterium]|jgi:hypothetical protein